MSTAAPITAGITRKRGRKPEHYRATWGEVVNGLARRPSDGRWRIIGTETTYTELDERLAVHRFKMWQARQSGEKVALPVAEMHDASKIGPAVRKAAHQEIVISVPRDHRKPLTVDRVVFGDEVWPWLRQLILERPQHVAERTGIAEIAYLADLPCPKPSPNLRDIGQLYFDKAPITKHEKQKSEKFWNEFCAVVGIQTVKDLTAEIASTYLDHVFAAGQSGTYVKHRFGKIKTILHFALRRGVASQEIRNALDACAVLVAPKATVLDPHPISRDHYHKLLNAADPQMQAMLLLALNACLYAKETCDLRWSDLDLKTGVLLADRGKTGVCRVAILWGRTLKALQALPQRLESPFVSIQGSPHNANTLTKAFRRLRVQAGVPQDVTFGNIRDGGYTTAVQAGVQFHTVQMLAGHRNGMSDHYVKRSAFQVADACKAIERHYFDEC
ncbi:MAG: tyrosine-type recombinase/integrase [Tepidisphaeraceae bacterium]|jgi:integrase